MFAKKILLPSFVLALLLALIFFAWHAWITRGSESTIGIQLDENQVVMESSGFNFKQKDTKTRDGVRAVDTEYSYDVVGKLFKVGELTVTVRKLENGDQFVFNRFVNTSSHDASLPLEIKVNGVDSYDFLDFNDEEPVREHDKTYGIDPTTNVKGLYTLKENESTKYELYLSQNYISTEKKENYPDSSQSVLRELVAEDTSLHMNEESEGIRFQLSLRTKAENQISENWFLLSKEDLIKNKRVLEKYKDETNHNFLHTPKWNTAEGNYTKLPWSIEPGTELGYGRNLVAMQDKTSLNYYIGTKERLFYDLVINSINHLENFRKSNNVLWETEYTSTWLKNSYGITAPYTDTRHNENIALFLTQAGKELGIGELEDRYLLYAEFLSNQKELGNVIQTENGYYISDYFSSSNTKKTHASLNHALGEMNFLLKTYQDSQNQTYLDTALQIKNAVEDSGQDWINRENGDLWYQINEDLTFEGDDYPTLTFDDLMRSLILFTELDIPYDTVWVELIESKITFIIENDIEVKHRMIDQLKRLGIGEKLYDYRNTTDF